jgi:hypothetical protein
MTAIPRHLLDSIPRHFHAAVVDFLETGDAPQEFMDFVDGNHEAQRVLDAALALLTADLAASARKLAPRQARSMPEVIAEQVLQLSRNGRETTMQVIYANLDPEEQFNHQQWIVDHRPKGVPASTLTRGRPAA